MSTPAFFGTWNIPRTIGAGADYQILVPPFTDLTPGAGTNVPAVQSALQAWTGLQVLDYTNAGGSNQTLTVMRPVGATRLAAAALGGQAVVSLDADPGKYAATLSSWGFGQSFQTPDAPIAANDYVAFQYPDGTYGSAKVLSAATLATVTLSSNLGTGGLPKGSPLWLFKFVGAVNPYDALPHPQWTLFGSEYAGAGLIAADGAEAPFVSSYGPASPLLLYVSSTTGNVTIERGTVVYYNRATPFSNYYGNLLPLWNPAPNG